MGLIKLALIGGAAYYAGKKLNEPHYDAQGNIIQNPHQGHHGGWCQRKRWHERHQQQQQQSDPSQYPNQGMTREGPYQDYPEKPHMTQTQHEYHPQHIDYPSTYHNEYTHPQSKAYYHLEPSHDAPREIKPRPHSPVQTKQMVKFDTSEVPTTPPAYAGYTGRPLSPQQRMYSGANGMGMGMGVVDNMGRSESAPVPPQVQQAQHLYHQQMEFGEPKKAWSLDKLMWK